MNFDTRTIIDLIKLNDKLKDTMLLILEEEISFNKRIVKKQKVEKYVDDSSTFSDTIIPQMKDCIKVFLKKELKDVDLSIIGELITINNVDYSIVIKFLTN